MRLEHAWEPMGPWAHGGFKASVLMGGSPRHGIYSHLQVNKKLWLKQIRSPLFQAGPTPPCQPPKTHAHTHTPNDVPGAGGQDPASMFDHCISIVHHITSPFSGVTAPWNLQ